MKGEKIMETTELIKVEKRLWDEIGNVRAQAFAENDIKRADIIGEILNEISKIISEILNESQKEADCYEIKTR